MIRLGSAVFKYDEVNTFEKYSQMAGYCFTIDDYVTSLIVFFIIDIHIFLLANQSHECRVFVQAA